MPEQTKEPAIATELIGALAYAAIAQCRKGPFDNKITHAKFLAMQAKAHSFTPLVMSGSAALLDCLVQLYPPNTKIKDLLRPIPPKRLNRHPIPKP